MSTDRFLELFESLRKDYVTVRDRPVERNTMEDYQHIDEQFTAMLNDPELGDGEGVIAACEERAQQLDQRRSELDAELLRLQETLARNQEELQARLSGNYVERIEDVSEALSRAQDKKLYQTYCTQLSELAGGAAVAKTVFKGLLAKSVSDLREDRACAVDVRFAEPANWHVRREQLHRLLNDVQRKASLLNLAPPVKEESLVEEVCKLAGEASRHLADAAEERKRRDAKLATFYGECDKLSLWCRQQLANLDAMQEPDHIQEYCRTLVDNYKTMSSNFAVLVGSVQPYVRDNHVPVRKALVDVDQVWYYVMVAAFERLSKTLFEIHPKSRLEDEVERYAQYPKHLMELLKTIRIFLQQETDLSTEGEALLRECEKMCDTVVGKKEATTVKRLQAFAQRARISRDAYQCFREAIVSRLTYSTAPSDVVLESKRRQMEFEECTKELKTWAAAQAHGESWRDIYSKIAEIKRVIQQEQEYIDERAGAPAS